MIKTDALGNIASDLIGVLDNRYAANIQNIIRQMQRNEKEAFNLINQHTIIIKQTAKLVKQNNICHFPALTNDHLKSIKPEAEFLTINIPILLSNESMNAMQVNEKCINMRRTTCFT